MKLIDLSTNIREGMPKPPSIPKVSKNYLISQSEIEEEEKGFSNKLEQFTITTHVGTHFDAPSHFTCKGKNIDQYTLKDFFMVPTIVLEVFQESYGAVALRDIKKAEEKSGEVQFGDLVILNTGFYRFYEEERYLKSAYVSMEAAQYLVEKGMKILGIDCFTVDDIRKETRPIHIFLLKEKGILIIESIINLDNIFSPRFNSICFPLNIKNGSGSFTRMVAVFE